MNIFNNPVVYFQGGLGNQFFQYAFFLDLKSSNKEAMFDIGRLVYDKQHGNISIVNFLDVNKEYYKISKNTSLPILIRDSFLSKCFRFFNRSVDARLGIFSYYDYDAMSSYLLVSKNKKNYVGYFQFVESALYAKISLEERILELYRNKLHYYDSIYKEKVGLHIRRGDFVFSNDSKHECIDLSFIQKAIKYVDKNVVVFSDDIEWCKKNIEKTSSLEFHCGEGAIDDFLAMSQCSNYILSGSTFSWWAAFLFSSSKTEVFFPKGSNAQFISKYSNDKIGWLYTML